MLSNKGFRKTSSLSSNMRTLTCKGSKLAVERFSSSYEDSKRQLFGKLQHDESGFSASLSALRAHTVLHARASQGGYLSWKVLCKAFLFRSLEENIYNPLCKGFKFLCSSARGSGRLGSLLDFQHLICSINVKSMLWFFDTSNLRHFAQGTKF